MPAIKKVMQEGTIGPAVKHGDIAKIVWRMIHRKTKKELNQNQNKTGDNFVISDDSAWQYNVIGHKVNSLLIIKVDKDMQVTLNGDYMLSIVVSQVGAVGERTEAR